MAANILKTTPDNLILENLKIVTSFLEAPKVKRKMKVGRRKVEGVEIKFYSKRDQITGSIS